MSTHIAFTHSEIAGTGMTVAVAFDANVTIQIVGNIDRRFDVTPRTIFTRRPGVTFRAFAQFD